MKAKFFCGWILVILAYSFGIGDQTPPSGIAQEQPPHYKGIQSVEGHPFPAPESELLYLRDHPDKQGYEQIRAHAWYIFQGLADGDAAWQTWYTKCDLKLMVKDCPPAAAPGAGEIQRIFRNFELPVQSLNFLEKLYLPLPVANAQALKTQGRTPFETAASNFIADFKMHPQFASVLFNKEAADHILSYCLYPHLGNTTASGAPCLPAAKQGEIAEFDRPSIVLKTVWEVVHNDPNRGPQFRGPLTTWDSKLWNRIHAKSTNPSSFSKDRIWIDTTPGRECEDRDYDDGEAVPVGCFFAHELTSDDIKRFPTGLLEIDDNLYPGDYMILVAMHVTTKEIPEWVWATFWWDNRAFSDSYGKGRPRELGKQWRHFLMNTTLSGTTPLERDCGPKICFNPYLETNSNIQNGIISNCVQCHSFAGYGPGAQPMLAYDLGVLARDGKSLASRHTANSNYFNNVTKTDFLWSLAPPHDSTLKGILDSLHKIAALK